MTGVRCLLGKFVESSARLRSFSSIKKKSIVTAHLTQSIPVQQRSFKSSAMSFPGTIGVKKSSGKLLPTQSTHITRKWENFHTTKSVNGDEGKYVPSDITEFQYEALAEYTLNSLSDFFDELPENFPCTDEYESQFSSGVLTVHFSTDHGTYVLNKQTPNKQIWLSSPKSGPKRYDFCDGKWIYRRNGEGIHSLLEEEISEILESKISMSDCKHYS